MRRLLISVIEFYQTYLSFDKGILTILAPGGACKYSISCSQYTKQNISRYGVAKGLGMGLKRIWSCR